MAIHLSTDLALGGQGMVAQVQDTCKRKVEEGRVGGRFSEVAGSCGWSLTCCPSEVGFPGGVAAQSRPVVSACTVRPRDAPVTPCGGMRLGGNFIPPKAAPSASSPRALQGWTKPSSGWLWSPGCESAPGSRR